ncbi:hypothetical protein ANANG_G00185680 [Anguilla anguilla]|uniref:Apolipoprotein M n=1 Tax=Anguilla anguilla TaxID=7936 RepID=A0A9D3MCI4_ANGAN|nr:hypothetical protein ANANG_G00185680 [Anguilla anguilla]
MFRMLCSLLLYVYGLFQNLFPCSAPQLLSVHHLNTQQYLGTWYFIAAAGSRPSDLEQFTSSDSTVFVLQEATKNSTHLLTGAIRIGDSCLSNAWTYHITPDKDYLDLEDVCVLWNGLWLNCPDCILLEETDLGEIKDGINRVMLYARNGSLSTSVVKNFQAKMSCLGMIEFYSLPQEREYCQYDGMASD